jgi:DNA-binding response OmpR family regulator
LAPLSLSVGQTAFDGDRSLPLLNLGTPRFRIIDAHGTSTDVVDLDHHELRFSRRSLAIDGVRGVVWRHGREVLNLSPLRQLKRLFYVFAFEPGNVVSKAAIVRAVWNERYEPRIHNPQIHSHVSRIRKILGSDGPDILLSAEGGYHFRAPHDFLFVIELEGTLATPTGVTPGQ